MKNFTLKDNRAIQVTLERNSFYCQIDAVDACDQHNVGRLIFKHRGGKAFLCTIAVTDKDYLQAGVGSIMLQCFESYCKSKRIEYIEGRFFPEGEGAEYAKDFYNRHDYSITKDDYDQYLFKPIYRYTVSDKYSLLKCDVETNKDTPSSDGYGDGM